MATFNGTPQDFANQMASYALAAQNATGINANLILAQWGNETAWGTSPAFKNDFNVAGIGITSSSVKGDNYGSIQGGVEAYINFINSNARYQKVKAAGANDPEQQALLMGQSGYADGGYLAKGSTVQGSALIADMQSFQAPTGVQAATGLSMPVTAGTSAAAPGTNVTNTNAPEGSTTSQVAANQQAGLADIIASVLQPYGLDTPGILNWATGASTQFASQGMTDTQIATQLGVELQDPTISTTDPLLAGAQTAFQNMYPGIALRAKNGLPPITVAEYQAYQDNIYQQASAVGITPAQLNGLAGADGKPGDAVATLIGGDVDPTEVATRLQQGYEAATQANPETLKLLQEYYPTVFPQGANGSTAGSSTNSAILSYYLNPTNTISMLNNQITAAQIGTEGVNSEFGGIPVAQAQQLQQAGVTQSTARSTFEQLAKLTPLEQALPGVATTNNTISQSQLVDEGFFGANQQLLENVESNRKAPFSGGGGYAATSKGIVGAGGASTAGVQGT